MIEPEQIAAICHDANRRYCRTIDDRSQRLWEEAPWWQKQAAIAGVVFFMKNPKAPPSSVHDNWLKNKTEDGWTYAAVKDEEAKTHPCLVPYVELPPEIRLKDVLFRNIILTFIKGDTDV